MDTKAKFSFRLQYVLYSLEEHVGNKPHFYSKHTLINYNIFFNLIKSLVKQDTYLRVYISNINICSCFIYWVIWSKFHIYESTAQNASEKLSMVMIHYTYMNISTYCLSHYLLC